MTASLDNRELGAPADAHRFDEAALDAFLKDHIPGFEGNSAIRQFLGGQSNPTYLLEDSSGRYVLRKKPPGHLLPSAHAVDREYRVISALAKSAVPVPKTYLLCEDTSIIGQIFYVMDYVPGRVMTERDMPGCSAGERTAMFRSMATVLGSLHAVDHIDVGLKDFGKPSGYVARQIARWSKQYEASKLEDFEPMEAVIDWLSNNNPNDDLTAIVHGDYRPGNLIFNNNDPGIAAVLDWELSTIGHPLADVAYFLMPYRLDARLTPWGIKGLDLAALGIPAESSLLEVYAAAAGRATKPDIDYYIVFSMFRLAAILAGVLRRGIDGNAADPRAVDRGRTYQQLAELAWSIASESSA